MSLGSGEQGEEDLDDDPGDPSGSSAATDHPHLTERREGEVESDADVDAEDHDPAAEYEYAHNLAQTGRPSSLCTKREYLIRKGICTEDEFDALLVEAITTRMGELIRGAETIKGQIAYIRKEMGWGGADDSGQAESVDSIRQQLVDLNTQRSTILTAINQRRVDNLRVAAEMIIRHNPEEDPPVASPS